MRKRRKPENVSLTEGDDLAIDWGQWADGRARRLKVKRYFGDIDPALARKEAEAAAKRMGKAVQAVKDRDFPEKYMWVQFADHKIGPGEPCPCGSRRLLRVHGNFARCPECHAQLLLSDVVETDEERETRAASTLLELTDVHLARRERSETHELYRGYGRQEDALVFLLVEFHIKPKEDTVSPEDVFDRVSSVRVVPFPELADLYGVPSLELSSLWGGREPNWDFAWPTAPSERLDRLRSAAASSADSSSHEQLVLFVLVGAQPYELRTEAVPPQRKPPRKGWAKSR